MTDEPRQREAPPGEGDLVERFFNGDRAALARIITLVENRSPEGNAAYRKIYGRGGEAHRIGITGPIGVGKSTLVARLAAGMRTRGKQIGIVAIDPTSPFSHGALLGDRVRMTELGVDEGVFTRSLATRGNTGGLSAAARMVVDVLEAFGKQIILVETVGVGQSDLDVLDLVDTAVVMLMPGSGDSIQMMKAGLMEIADLFVLNKADQPGIEQLDAEVSAILDMSQAGGPKAWRPPVVRTQADKGIGVDDCLGHLLEHLGMLTAKGLLHEKRRRRLHRQIKDLLLEDLTERLWRKYDLDERIRSSVADISPGNSDPLGLKDELLCTILNGA